MTDLVFVHGWSVTDTDTYGGLPERLVNDGGDYGLHLRRRDIYLGRYISFHDEVRVEDLARAMEDAVRDNNLGTPDRFVCVTHSTGGPVVREWHDRFYAGTRRRCPMQHLVMLAPANHGSALAALGRARVGRLKALLSGVEPGQGVLDWLELGSPQSLDLNRRWILEGARRIGGNGIFPFVLTGQYIDRAFYDNLNSYTGELGSDGVVRCAAANMNATYMHLKQIDTRDQDDFSGFRRTRNVQGPPVAFRIVSARSHSGENMGVMRCVSVDADRKDTETVDAILRCCQVADRRQYNRLIRDFAAETAQVQEDEKVEHEDRLLRDRYFIHDRFAQVIFHVTDTEGHPVTDFDLLLTAGPDSDPNALPEGFFQDRQRNNSHPETITYFVNSDKLFGVPEVPGHRPALRGAGSLGLEVHPRPHDGFVHYRKARIRASSDILRQVVRPNETTIVDIELQRIVHKNAFRFDSGPAQGSFKDEIPGPETID